MSMSVNVHLKSAEHLSIKAYVAENNSFREPYSVTRLQSDSIDVSIFAELADVELLIKELQKVRTQLKKKCSINA